VRRAFHHLAIAQQRYASPVFEVNGLDRVEVMQQAEAVLEALCSREKRRRKTKMPFADASRRVAVRPQQFRDGQLIGMNAPFRVRPLHPGFHPDPAGVTAGEQSRAGRAADRGRRVIVCEAHPLRRHGIDPRRGEFRRAVAAQVIVALVVDQDKDNIGPPGFGREPRVGGI